MPESTNSRAIPRHQRHRSAKARDLGPLEAEKELEQFGQCLRVGHVAAQYLLPVLPQHRQRVVAEDDVVLRVAILEFLADLGIQVVVGVLGFPIAQRHAQFMQQRAVNGDVGFGGGLERVFGQKHQPVLFAPGLEQVFECLAHDGLAAAAADLLDEIELLEVVVDQELAHTWVPWFSWRSGENYPGGNRRLEKLRPAWIARRSISAADSSQPFCSRKSRNARVLTLRQLSGSRKLVRAIL